MIQGKWGKKKAWEFAYIAAGSALYALAIVWFLNGVKLVPGSVIGIAVILRALFDTPSGLANRSGRPSYISVYGLVVLYGSS